MGIDNLWKAIKEEDCMRTIPLGELRDLVKTDHCRVAIDTAWVSSAHYRGQWSGMVKANKNYVENLPGICIKTLLELDARLKSYGFDTVWCLDGDRNPNKLATGKRIGDKEKKLRAVAKRYKLCQKLLAEAGRDESMLEPFRFVESQLYLLDDDIVVDVPEDATLTAHLAEIKKTMLYCAIMPTDLIRRICAVFSANNVQFLRVPSISEGEKLACVLMQQGYCQVVHCNDGDSIVLGARCIIKAIDGGMATVYRYSDILAKLGMNHRAFLYFCILCGCDFNSHVEGIGAVKAKKLLDDPRFNIYDYNQENFGCLRINRCIAELTISEKDHENTLNEIARMPELRTRKVNHHGINGGNDDDEIIEPMEQQL